MRQYLTAISASLLFFALQQSYGQSSNAPSFHSSKSEPLGEKENSFAGGGGKKHSLFSGGLFGHKSGFNHVKTTQAFSSHNKINRNSFQNKHYGKKNIFGRHKSNGWGGKSFKTNGKEDKRLFKGSQSKRRKKK